MFPNCTCVVHKNFYPKDIAVTFKQKCKALSNFKYSYSCFEAYWALFTLQECEKLNYYIIGNADLPNFSSESEVLAFVLHSIQNVVLYYQRKKERKSYSVSVLSIKLSFKCQMYIPRSSKYPSVFSGYNKNTPTWSKTVPANLNLQLLGALSRVTFLVQLPLLCMWWLIQPQSLQNWTQLQNRYDMMHYVTKQTMGAPRSQTLKMASLKKNLRKLLKLWFSFMVVKKKSFQNTKCKVFLQDITYLTAECKKWIVRCTNCKMNEGVEKCCSICITCCVV